MFRPPPPERLSVSQENGDTVRRASAAVALLWMLTLAVVALCVYSPALRGRHYDDDFWFLFGESGHGHLHWFTHRNPASPYGYRPIEAMVYSALQRNVGLWNTLPIHLVTIGAHVGVAWLVFWFMRRAGFSAGQVVIGSLFMLLSQVNAYAVAANDTLSQVLGTLFGCGALVLLWLAYGGGPASGRRTDAKGRGVRLAYAAAVVAFACSLLSKETSAGFGIGVAGLLLWTSRLHLPWGPALRQATVRLVPFVLVAGAYLGVRHAVGVAGAQVGTGYHDIQLGFNVIRNIVFSAAASTVPGCGVHLYLAVRERDTLFLACVGALTVTFCVSVLYGVYREGRWRTVCASAALALAALFPVVLMNVSELYVYNAMPFVAAVIGIGLGSHVRRTRRRAARLTAVALIAAVLTVHAEGAWHKASLMRQNGERADAMLQQVVPLVRSVPPNANVILLQPDGARPAYSVFIVDDMRLLRFATGHVKGLSGRSDVTVSFSEADELRSGGVRPGSVLFTSDRGRVVVVNDGEESRRAHGAVRNAESVAPTGVERVGNARH
jgi:hypothetical protein